MLKNLEIIWDLEARLESSSEKFGIWSNFKFRVGNNPAFFGAHLKECQFLYFLILSVV
jgi:hypothetical protein